MNAAIGNIWASMLSLISPEVLLLIFGTIIFGTIVSMAEKEEVRRPRRRGRGSRRCRLGRMKGFDEKVDDFINMFNQQIKLQRYEEMLTIESGRGSKTDHGHHLTRSKSDTACEGEGHVHLVRSMSSISELTNMLVSTKNRSLIAIKDFDHCAGMLPNLKNELTGSCLLKFLDVLLSSCGGEKIFVLTTNHRDLYDAALLHPFNMDIHIHTSSPQPIALPDGGEIVELDSSEQKPLPDFDATINNTYQSGLLVSDSENKNMIEESKRWCMTESVPSLVDSTTRRSSIDFDALDNRAHLVMAHQINPIISFDTEEKGTREGVYGECLTKSVLSFDDSTKREPLPDFVATENEAHLVRAYQSGPIVFLSENKNRGESVKEECITKSILDLEDLQQHSGGRRGATEKSIGTIHDQGFHVTGNISWKSFDLLPREQPNDCLPLSSLGRLRLEGCVQPEKSPDLPRVAQINGVEQRVTKSPRYLGGLTAQVRLVEVAMPGVTKLSSGVGLMKDGSDIQLGLVNSTTVVVSLEIPAAWFGSVNFWSTGDPGVKKTRELRVRDGLNPDV
ncbi:hypothetical protein Vadar_027017 [Vaccinium darrowii]|uniref:Uncharacterized protein n=1 Tax=Vaccinium darrowii TaxID=229202 RepID=A0ACB7YHG8_9ERIC|nr:hypothetical protein Vadar_027017 [Vaccinium darrowii]